MNVFIRAIDAKCWCFDLSLELLAVIEDGFMTQDNER